MGLKKKVTSICFLFLFLFLASPCPKADYSLGFENVTISSGLLFDRTMEYQLHKEISGRWFVPTREDIWIDSNISKSGRNSIGFKLNPLESRVELKVGDMKNNQTKFVKFSIFVPSDYEPPTDWNLFAQWWQGAPASPPVAFEFVPNVKPLQFKILTREGNSEKNNIITHYTNTIKTNSWTDFIIKLKIDNSEEKAGILKVWQNNNVIVDYQGKIGYSDLYKYTNFRFGVYRSERNDSLVKLYFDEVKMGSSYVDEVNDQSVKVTGKAEPHSIISINVEKKVIGTATVAQDGQFSVSIPKQKAETKLSVTVTNSAINNTHVTSVLVNDVTPPPAPVVNHLTEKTTNINGVAEAGSEIIIKAGTKELIRGKVDFNGKFNFTVERQPVGTIIVLVAKDNAGNRSVETIIVVAKDAVEIDRIAGTDRLTTALAISKSGWNTAHIIVLATASDFPDALAGGPLAYRENAPILLTRNDSLNVETKQEIKRLSAKKVLILGSESAVSKEVEVQLKQMNLAVERIGGQTRFETAALIAEKMKSDKVVVANGLDFPDVLSVSSYAAKNGIPILLTRKDHLPEETQIALKNKTSSYVIGNIGAVSERVLKDLPKPIRLGGKDRYETGYVVATTLALGTNKAYIATGMNFPDALAGSVLAAKNDAPILLVRPAAIPEATNKQLFAYSGFSIFGGTGAVTDRVMILLDEASKK